MAGQKQVDLIFESYILYHGLRRTPSALYVFDVLFRWDDVKVGL